MPPGQDLPVNHSKASVAVLGAGLSGLAAAQSLRGMGYCVEVYEKNSYAGGHAFSHRAGGFTFDEGPHISFTKMPEIQELFARAVNGQYFEVDARVTNYWRGHWVLHPAQTNLFGLPTDVVERCLVDFVKCRYGEPKEIRNYADWCLEGLGRSFSEDFTFQYTRKYWTTEPSNMTVDWVGPRMHRPSLEEVIHGALAPQTEKHHYITRFRYPDSGGFGSYVQAVADGQALNLDHEVMLVDLRKGSLEFANGTSASFDRLVSSLPLPELIARIKDVPASVAEAAAKLTCTSLVLVNIGIDRDCGFPDAHWMYCYDEDNILSRISFPHHLSPANAPAGQGAIQAEVYHSKYRPLATGDVLACAIEDLQKIGLLHKSDNILLAMEQRMPYANVLFDVDRKANLDIVHGYLAEKGVFCCGRYGEWAYYWSDDSVVSGFRAAKLLNERIQASPRKVTRQ